MWLMIYLHADVGGSGGSDSDEENADPALKANVGEFKAFKQLYRSGSEDTSMWYSNPECLIASIAAV